MLTAQTWYGHCFYASCCSETLPYPCGVASLIKFVCVQVLQLQLLQDEQHAKHQRQIVNLKDELAQLRCTHLQCVSSLQASKKETLVNC